MKKTIMLGLTMLLSAVGASAQFVGPMPASTTTATPTSTVTNTKSGHFGAGWIERTITPDYDNADDQVTDGFYVNYLKDIPVSQTMPLYIQTGGMLDFGWWSDSTEETSEYYAVDYKLTTIALSVPVNAAYKIQFEKGYLMPYAGLNLRGNLYATQTIEVDKTNSKPKDYNMFDKKDTGSKNATWSRFQAGANIGAMVCFEKYYLNVCYQPDFTELCKKTTTGAFMAGVGVNF